MKNRMSTKICKLPIYYLILELLFILIVELPSVASSRQFRISQVKATWKKGECPWKGNTLCYSDSKLLISSGVSAADQKEIVHLHNKYRSKANPPPTDLMALTWDPKVAKVAQKLANQCKLFHDKDRSVPGYGVHIGQNIAMGYSDWDDAINGWYSEKKEFKFGKHNSFMAVGHFTQILFEKTSRIGCGFSKCKTGDFYVCNYASGQLNYAFQHPYKAGKVCGMCPKTCNKGLCDCKGKLCLNNGQINPNTCKCKCEGHFTGDFCEHLDCSKPDLYICPKVWPPSYCKMFANVPSICPHMCKVCK